MALRIWEEITGKAKKHFHRAGADPLIYDTEDGVKKLVKDLKMYDRENIEFAKERIGDFWNLRKRNDGESLKDYVIIFDDAWKSLSETGEYVSDRILLDRLMDQAGLSLKDQRDVLKEIGNDYNYELGCKELTKFSRFCRFWL